MRLSFWRGARRKRTPFNNVVGGELICGRVTSHLFVGGELGPDDWEALAAEGVSVVVNLQQEEQDRFADEEKVDGYLWLPSPDQLAPTLGQISTGVGFIASAIAADQRVFVHCKAGQGRAPLLCACYLLTQDMTPLEAIARVSQARPRTQLTPIQSQRLREFAALCEAEAKYARFQAYFLPTARRLKPRTKPLDGEILTEHSVPRPVMLCILDGWGLSQNPVANAVTLGRTPNFDKLWSSCPHTQLSASGSDVGLQPGVFGNSEVGHLNIGAGRVVWQDSLIIDQAIDDGSFFQNETLLAAMHHARDNGTNLQLIGLISNGSVHSSETHYFALLEMAAREGLRADQVWVHAFTDGRDTAPRSADEHIGRLLAQMKRTGVGAVASVIGRYFAMDRDNRWERVQQAYECMVSGAGHIARDTMDALKTARERDENDEFITATVVLDAAGNPRPRIAENDAVIFFNYRSDRGRQLAQAFTDAEFDDHLREESQQPGAHDAEETPIVRKFRRTFWPQTHFASMTRYSTDLVCPYAFEPRPQRDGLGETVGKAGKTQLRIAETEKYPHVSFFFSGGIEVPWPGEERILIPSPKVATYDLQPEMSSVEVTKNAVKAIRSEDFDLVVLNFAQTDMVGHTGILQAATTAVESADEGLGKIMDAIEDVGGALLVIADHGNCEQMMNYETGEPHTAHTTNPVPCLLFNARRDEAKLRDGGRLADVAPTLLDLMQVAQPAAMTGISLLSNAPERAAEAQVALNEAAAENTRTRLENTALSPAEMEIATRYESNN